MQTNHIAILVRNIDAVSRTLPDSCKQHALTEQPTEGTLEQYVTVGDGKTPAILLMQAIADGPYRRALKKRGAGLHHLGCVCSNIEEELASGAARRLLLHPISLQSRKHGTVWLCKPGLPYLVELIQNSEQDAIPHEKVVLMLPSTTSIPEYASALSSNLIVKNAEDSSVIIRFDGIQITIHPNIG